jgi:hypothetical protein
LASPQQPLISKKQMVALFALAAASVIGPVPQSHYSHDNAVAGFATGIILLPFAVALAALATPGFEAWALALRQSRRPRWSEDDASPYRGYFLMVLLFVAALTLRLSGFPSQMNHGEFIGFVWALATARTIPLFTMFANTRYSTGPARFAFSAAAFAHVLFQVIVIGIFAAQNGLPPAYSGAAVAVEAGILLAVIVPGWILYCQRRLRARVRTGAPC